MRGEQQRTEAITTLNNRPAKAALMFAMKPGYYYTAWELMHELEMFVGQRMPFSPSLPGTYCRTSLEPIGAVVEGVILRRSKKTLAYTLTPDALVFGQPSAVRFLEAANATNVSLNSMNGCANTNGSMRIGYAIARVLEMLSDGKVHTKGEMEKILGRNATALTYVLVKLSKIGFIRYESLGTGAYEDATQKGFAVAVLKDEDKHLAYLKNHTLLIEDGRAVAPGFMHIGSINVRRALNLNAQTLECNSLAETLGVTPTIASQIIVVFCRLGIYEYQEWGGHVLSEVELLKNGRTAYNLAYLPALRVARRPGSDYTRRGFRRPLEETDKEHLLSLLRVDFRKYKSEREKRTPQDHERKRVAVISVFESNPEKVLRAGEIAANLNIATASARGILSELLGEGLIGKTRPGRFVLTRKA